MPERLVPATSSPLLMSSPMRVMGGCSPRSGGRCSRAHGGAPLRSVAAAKGTQMMGQSGGTQDRLFYNSNIDNHIPRNPRPFNPTITANARMRPAK